MNNRKQTQNETDELSLSNGQRFEEEFFENLTGMLASPSSSYKVRGKEAISDGTAVQGHNTAGSGTAHGVEGITDSENTDAAGVYALAANGSGSGYGLRAVNDSDGTGSAAIRADGTNGAKGVWAVTDGAFGVEVDTTGYTGIQSTVDSTGYNAVEGYNNASDGLSWGVRGDTDSTDDSAYGVRGNANASSGSGKGVGGFTYGEADGAAGVYGEAFDSAGKTYGVHGITNSTNSDATGVYGQSVGAEGRIYGVRGVTDSATTDAAGVRGRASKGSGVTYGVDGISDSKQGDAAGVRGQTAKSAHGVIGETYDTESNLPSLASFESAGVFGRSDKSDGWGVAGWSKNNDAVFGRTDDSGSYALYGFNTASDSYALGVFDNADIKGYADINDVGVSAYLSSNYSVPDSTTETVQFDSTVDDHFGGFDTSTGVYTIQQAGDYHVDFLIDWSDSFTEGDQIRYNLEVNDATSRGIAADTDVATSTDPARCFSKTVMGLTSGDTLKVTVYQNSGSGKQIFGSGGNEETYLTIHKVG